MSEKHYDQLETRDPAQRELAQFNLLPDLIRHAMEKAPGWAAQLKDVHPGAVTTRAALAKLPVLRKSALKDLQAKSPPYGGFTTSPAGSLARIFMSPGPIFEPEGLEALSDHEVQRRIAEVCKTVIVKVARKSP